MNPKSEDRRSNVAIHVRAVAFLHCRRSISTWCQILLIRCSLDQDKILNGTSKSGFAVFRFLRVWCRSASVQIILAHQKLLKFISKDSSICLK
jgi:hypothetical protein